MRFVRAIEEKDADQQHEGEREAGKNYAWLAQLAVIPIHQPEHSGDSQHDVDQLAQQENVSCAELFACGHGRGAENHHYSDQAERQGDAK